jgi:hypothetical protein
MEFTNEDRDTIKAACELIWKKGTHHPQEAAIAFKFTQLVERLIAPVPPKPPEVAK